MQKWRGHIPKSSRSDQLIGNIDILRTIAEILEYPLKENEGTDSYSILPALIGNPKNQIREHLIIAPPRKTHLAIRYQDWLFIGEKGSGGGGPHTDVAGLRAISWTNQKNSDITKDGAIRDDVPPKQLYLLSEDLSQTQNIYEQRPEIVKKLDSLLIYYQKSMSSLPTIGR